jgi:hypothetical protein
MTNIPANTVSQEDLAEWYRLQEELKKIKASEMLLRQKIFAFYFPAPKEGTNDAPLDGGYVLKGKHTINREVDPGALGALKDKLLEAGIKADALVQYKPSLVLKKYRTLTEEQHQLFDQCLIVKPGSPALEIVSPAKAKKAGEQA